MLDSIFKRVACSVLSLAGLASLGGLGAHAAPVSGMGTWESTLQGRDLDGNAGNGFEAYYDTALDLTWLADGNHALTSGYDSDGLMTWDESMTWVQSLNVNGVGGWRLPTLVDTGTPGCNWSFGGTDCGYNIDANGSELAHMYQVTLGNLSAYSPAGVFQPDFPIKNTGPFKNVQITGYWTNVTYGPDEPFAWRYGGFDEGAYQSEYSKTRVLYALAVRSGDVAAVPEPEAGVMVLAALGVVGVAVRRRRPI